MTHAPALQRPMSAGPIMASAPNFMYRNSSLHDANSQEQRCVGTSLLLLASAASQTHAGWRGSLRMPTASPFIWQG